MNTIQTVVIVSLFVAMVIAIIRSNRPTVQSLGGLPVTQVLSHWSNRFPLFSMSSDEFYSKLEETLASHHMPDVTIGRANNKQGGMFSASREYLRVKHRDLVFDVCAAPFGRHFFISWWLYETSGMMQQIFKYTKAGEYLSRRAARRTFYQADEEEMFRNCVHQVILETIEHVTKSQGLREMTDAEKAIKEGGLLPA